MTEDKRKTETTEERPQPEQARREALAKMGRFAAYTAPAMLGLLGATKARAAPIGPHLIPTRVTALADVVPRRGRSVAPELDGPAPGPGRDGLVRRLCCASDARPARRNHMPVTGDG